MQVGVRCSVAVHCLIFITGHELEERGKVTSSMLAESTGCNPAMVRSVLSALAKAGIIETRRGVGGSVLARKPTEVTLLDIFNAVDPTGLDHLIGVQDCDGLSCPVARNIRATLAEPYARIIAAVRDTMASITLADLLDEFTRVSGAGGSAPSHS